MTDADVVGRAADTLNHGYYWQQKRLFGGGYCVMGALMVAQGRTLHSNMVRIRPDAQLRRVARAVLKQAGHRSGFWPIIRLIGWNDGLPYNSGLRVYNILRETEARLRAEEAQQRVHAIVYDKLVAA